MNRGDGRIIFLVGADGCGKSYFSKWLHAYCMEKDYSSVIVWSRFNNYFSKPLLGLFRITGHNYYVYRDGSTFGFHDFESLSIFRYIYVFLQMIDVNIATYNKIVKPKKKFDVVVCERGPFDTFIDVLIDVDLQDTIFRKNFFYVLNSNFSVCFIDREFKNIIQSRGELKYDFKLQRKIFMYRKMSKIFHWSIIDNNGTIDDTKKQIINKLDI